MDILTKPYDFSNMYMTEQISIRLEISEAEEGKVFKNEKDHSIIVGI